MFLRHYCTHKEESRLVGCIESVRMLEAEIYSLFSQHLIIKLINLMADPERFKPQSPVKTDSPAVKCKRLKTSESLQKKKKETGPMRKQGYMSKGH